VPEGAAPLSAASFVAENGSLFAFRKGSIPFLACHMFFISAPPGSLRGRHAHRKTNQFLVVAAGSVEVATEDLNGREQSFLLQVGDGFHIPPFVWATQTFQGPNALLVVLTDEPYDEADYIRDYDEFLALREGQEESNAAP
jgi:UDP-2-acetamido-3-amino-2,3-dideoxy-glucuronate N-acetyltransferase